MRLVTFGLGGSKADFLRLGFGAAAAEEQVVVDGGYPFLRGQFRPAIQRPPILLHVEQVSRIALRLRADARVAVGVDAGRSRVGVAIRATAKTAVHVDAGKAPVGVAARVRAATSAARVHRGAVAVRAATHASVAIVRVAAPSRLVVRARAGGVTQSGRAVRSRTGLRCLVRSKSACVTRTAHRGRVALRVRARGTTNASTRVERIAEADQRDLELIALLVRQG